MPSLPIPADAAPFINQITAAQEPNRQGFDPYTLAKLMDKEGVPGREHRCLS